MTNTAEEVERSLDDIYRDANHLVEKIACDNEETEFLVEITRESLLYVNFGLNILGRTTWVQ